MIFLPRVRTLRFTPIDYRRALERAERRRQRIELAITLLGVAALALALAFALAGCGNTQQAKDARAELAAGSQEVLATYAQAAAKCAAAEVARDATPTAQRAATIATTCGLTALWPTVADAVKVAWIWIQWAIAQKKTSGAVPAAAQAPPSAVDTQKGQTP